MGAVRMKITIPEELARQVDQLTDPRKRSQLISEALEHRIEEIQRETAQKALEDGYKAPKEGSHLITKEFEAVDLEGWDEY
jgi:metal-responsive CopG/Arc/MetJ family transcriptional regulator